ncbi:MAG: 1-acyl-sn-glycerol-3-phosphate acyltransferase, partial [Microcystis sp. M53600_WE12]|nr:1-acyl-sn-glycerol-3-phosphate acyltransferase [Microcystis sp. M53600_WE12]
MSNLSLGAQPPLEFIPPDLNLLLLKGCQIFLPLWLQTQTNLREISAANLETLITFYQKSQEKKVRLLLAFRHPSINDPYCMAYLLWKLVPKKAKELGIKLPAPIHAHFMYDRGIPLWAGERVGWLYSKLGGTPIQRGKADLIGLRSARRLLLEGDYPLAAAPEGATNGHNELVSAIEPGISQLAFWGVDDVKKAKQQQEVIILPIGIQYFYLTPVWQEIEQILTNLETDSGLESIPNSSLEEKVLYERLFRLGERLLSLMEDFYRDF